MVSTLVTDISERINQINDDNIVLLRNITVLQWIFGDTSFLDMDEQDEQPIQDISLTNVTIRPATKQLFMSRHKELEDKWGQSILKLKRPDLKLNKQWTNKFGEHLCEEVYCLMRKCVWKPQKKQNYQPDYEDDTHIIEVKTGTYFTEGTAGEKILGVPYKYADIPELYSKPLTILCIGGAEKKCRENYGNLGNTERCTPAKQKLLDFMKNEMQTEYIGLTDILQNFIRN